MKTIGKTDNYKGSSVNLDFLAYLNFSVYVLALTEVICKSSMPEQINLLAFFVISITIISPSKISARGRQS